MGWWETYNAGPTKPHVIREIEGDPLGCGACGYHEGSHPRQSGREYDSIYGPKPDDQYPAPHDFVPRVQRYRVIDYSQVGWTTVYMAVENIESGLVGAVVVLIRRDRHGSLATKTMDESMGPGEARCPARILDKLSPIEDLYGPVLTKTICDNHTSNCEWQFGPEAKGKWTGWDKPHVNQRVVEDGGAAWATQWRAECRAYHVARKAKPKVTKGCKVRFAKPLRFTDGSERDEFVFEKGSTFRSQAGYGRFRISNWRDMQYEVGLA